MEIAVVGVSYKNSNVDLRGRVAFTTSMKVKAGKELELAGVPEHVILSTCNRSEVYISSSNMDKDIESVVTMYQSLAGSRIVPMLYIKMFDLAIRHVFEVACGLDSLVIGEDEILGQLKAAASWSREFGYCKKYLDKVIRESITFSKKVRSAYKLSENKLSVASIGVQFLKDQYEDLTDKKVLLIGTGHMGQLILKYLEQEGFNKIYLTNRTMNKEKIDFCIDKEVELIEYHQRYDYLPDLDIVISATASPHTIIKKSECPNLHKEILLLDMAVPRDIDIEMKAIEQVTIVTLDRFEEVVNKHNAFREETADQIRRLILEEVKEVELWLLRAKADRVIKGFHKRQADIVKLKEDQLTKMNLNKQQESQVLEMLNSGIWQMVKQPVEQLKKLKEKEDMDQYRLIIESLFGFEGGDSE